ncbi:hypothetical protein PCANC_08045 [Puccinia coronata f. sp. avenae]|uniref:tRNA pseudouridine(55) synthase n=1 Tax=Puccinia coronata f. sp. avenae TaxID=200324 RepID=A0A2N5V702_9BASI|nr:hypothetical protein PCANC_08045 [Puccinia coronata f. sp. avenae]
MAIRLVVGCSRHRRRHGMIGTLRFAASSLPGSTSTLRGLRIPTTLRTNHLPARWTNPHKDDEPGAGGTVLFDRTSNGLFLGSLRSTTEWRHVDVPTGITKGTFLVLQANQAKAIKIGQGGTLDPLASGVLIIGLNSGTKKLSNFLDCSKSYRSTGILGCKTDSYDSDGKTLANRSKENIGKSHQSLKMDGKPLYEYARNNIPLPRPIEARRCEVVKIEMVEWKEAGEHSYKWPTEMISEEESKIFQRAETLVKQTGVVKSEEPSPEKEENPPKKIKLQDQHDGPEDPQLPTSNPSEAQETTNTVSMDDNGKSPVFTLEMTVSSGTYVRTIVHDIGQAISSAATVVSLIRTRQGDFCLDTKTNETTDSKRLPCMEWSVFEKAIQSRTNDSEDPCDGAGLREWSETSLKHIQVS